MQPVSFPVHCTGSICAFHQVLGVTVLSIFQIRIIQMGFLENLPTYFVLITTKHLILHSQKLLKIMKKILQWIQKLTVFM